MFSAYTHERCQKLEKLIDETYTDPIRLEPSDAYGFTRLSRPFAYHVKARTPVFKRRWNRPGGVVHEFYYPLPSIVCQLAKVFYQNLRVT